MFDIFFILSLDNLFSERRRWNTPARFLNSTLFRVFFISSKTGKLKLLQDLDRETKDSYQITVIASDNGAHRLSSQVEVTLGSLDETIL